MVEQSAVNREVVGSSPTIPAIFWRVVIIGSRAVLNTVVPKGFRVRIPDSPPLVGETTQYIMIGYGT